MSPLLRHHHYHGMTSVGNSVFVLNKTLCLLLLLPEGLDGLQQMSL